MHLRKLLRKDADRMLAWMHTPDIVEHMEVNFGKLQLEDCYTFIEKAQDTTRNLHLAIADDADQYMGTVSLKNIDTVLLRAEFAIALCEDALGKGYAGYAMRKIIQYGFEQYNLKNIYWNVKKSNIRAIAFYKKMGFMMQQLPCDELDDLTGNRKDLGWYLIEAEQYNEDLN